MVQTGTHRLELREYPRPAAGPEEAWLRVEANGICGTDVEAYHGHLTELMQLDYAFIPGHEPLGFIDEIGEVAARRWGVSPGDRVAVEPMLRCGHCRECITGQYTQCKGWNGRNLAYGFVDVERRPQLWGGYSEYLYLHPNTIVHQVPANVPTGVASLWNALGGAVRWAGADAGTRPGDTVVIFGPGPRGLCSVVAAREAGAAQVIVTGLAADRPRLEVAKALGASQVVLADSEDVVGAVLEATGGRGADVAVDASAMATQPILDAIAALRPGGSLTLAGLKGGRPVPDLVTDKIIVKELVVRGRWGVDFAPYAEAIRIISSNKYALELMAPVAFPLDRAADAILTLSREVGDGTAIAVMLAN
jgi:threonine dehydrogenase-like Zn-dependent dehydrogenase